MTPLVSIIIPTYNRARLVCEAVESALGQTYPHVEVIVVDDGSTDDTRERIAAYGDRVRYLHQPNQGVSAARNHGFREARGEYVLFLDSDDLLVPDAIAILLTILRSDPALDAAFGDGEFVGPNGNTLGRISQKRNLELFPTFSDMVVQPPPGCPSILFRRDALARVEGPFDEQMWGHEDHDLLVRLTAAGMTLRGTHDLVFRYRIMGGNKSSPAPSSPHLERRRLSRVHSKKKILEMPQFAELDCETRGRFFRSVLLGSLLWDAKRRTEFLQHTAFRELPRHIRSTILCEVAVARMSGHARWAEDCALLCEAMRLDPLDLRLYAMLLICFLPPWPRRAIIRTYRMIRSGTNKRDIVAEEFYRSGL